MKLLRTGELYSLDRRAGIDTQVESAVKRFTLKHGVSPVHICYNPGDLFKDKHSENAPPVDKTLPPGHLWLELKEKEK